MHNAYKWSGQYALHKILLTATLVYPLWYLHPADFQPERDIKEVAAQKKLKNYCY